MQDAATVKGTQGDTWKHLIRAVGGVTAITKVYGPGVAVTRTGAGAYLLTWAENPGTYLGQTYSLSATTVADLAGHTVTFGAYSTTAFTLAFTMTNASDAAHDLAALEWVTVEVSFAQTGATL